MRCLIAGGAGFIGSHAVDHFVASGDAVSIVDKMTYAGSVYNIGDDAWNKTRDNFHFVDICDAQRVDIIVKTFKPEVIVNFAAETHVDNSIEDAMPFVKSNFEGAVTLAAAARKHNALFCQVSTDEVYGSAHASDGPLNGKPLAPTNPYSASKAAADMMVLANRNTYDQPYLIFRMSNNFGPRQHREKFLPKLIECMTMGNDFPLYGDGTQIREWTFAPDAVRAIHLAAQTALADRTMCDLTLHITADNHRTNLSMVEAVKASLTRQGIAFDPNVVKFVDDRPGHDRRYWLEDESGLEFTPFEAALDRTVASYARRF